MKKIILPILFALLILCGEQAYAGFPPPINIRKSVRRVVCGPGQRVHATYNTYATGTSVGIAKASAQHQFEGVNLGLGAGFNISLFTGGFVSGRVVKLYYVVPPQAITSASTIYLKGGARVLWHKAYCGPNVTPKPKPRPRRVPKP